LRSLQDRLIEIYAAGRQVVVMIDEAHAMPPETLEEIRLLSNLESSRHKLLHIVLFGQPELDERLSDSSMRQLKERITHNFALEPLRRGDIGSYLMFRIRAAGYRGPDLFTPSAILLISHASEGLTRRINILADKALLSAFSEDKHLIDSKQIKVAIRDAQFNPMRDGSAKPIKWVIGATVFSLVAGMAFIAGTYNSSSEPPPSAKTTSDVTAVITAPVQATPTAPTTPSTASTPTPVPAPAEPATVATVSAAPSAPTKTTETKAPPDLAERILATEEWLKKTPDSHYFIQLFSTEANNRQAVELFLEKGTQNLDPQQLRVYYSNLSGRPRYGVIYGDYPSIEVANSELTKLLQTRFATGPYIRSVRKLR
ncbi:MAG: AAA family ATPase, partial [Betaproteobacteria bacterium]